jgi:hypothetical protein
MISPEMFQKLPPARRKEILCDLTALQPTTELFRGLSLLQRQFIADKLEVVNKGLLAELKLQKRAEKEKKRAFTTTLDPSQVPINWEEFIATAGLSSSPNQTLWGEAAHPVNFFIGTPQVTVSPKLKHLFKTGFVVTNGQTGGPMTYFDRLSKFNMLPPSVKGNPVLQIHNDTSYTSSLLYGLFSPFVLPWKYAALTDSQQSDIRKFYAFAVRPFVNGIYYVGTGNTPCTSLVTLSITIRKHELKAPVLTTVVFSSSYGLSIPIISLAKGALGEGSQRATEEKATFYYEAKTKQWSFYKDTSYDTVTLGASSPLSFTGLSEDKLQKIVSSLAYQDPVAFATDYRPTQQPLTEFFNGNLDYSFEIGYTQYSKSLLNDLPHDAYFRGTFKTLVGERRTRITLRKNEEAKKIG